MTRTIKHEITTMRTGKDHYTSIITVNGVNVTGSASTPLNSFFACIEKLHSMRNDWYFRCPPEVGQR